VVVGVFGGSVAAAFALAAQSSPDFAAGLGRTPAWSGRRVRILNFAMPGFKQPQQLIALAYFLSLGQRFDLVLNIDGFNEVVTTQRNWTSGVEPSFPADTLWGEWGRQLENSVGQLGAVDGGFLTLYYRLDERKWLRQAAACAFATCYAFSRAMASISSRRAAERPEATAGGREHRLSLFPTSVQTPLAKDVDIFSYTADRWADASRSMQALARQDGAIYLHVLQPNQWLKAAGNYVPIDRDHIYTWVIGLVNAGYPRLVDRAAELSNTGVPVLDATNVLKGLAWRDAYLDDCCHYTDKGNTVLGTAIAARVAELQGSAGSVRR
jgi:hypothetical protein